MHYYCPYVCKAEGGTSLDVVVKLAFDVRILSGTNTKSIATWDPKEFTKASQEHLVFLTIPSKAPLVLLLQIMQVFQYPQCHKAIGQNLTGKFLN